MRNIREVINRIINEIPLDYYDLILDLKRIYKGSLYVAPEQVIRVWFEVCMVLTETLPNPLLEESPEWCKKIGRIIRAEE